MAEILPLCRARTGESLLVVSVGCKPGVRSRLHDLGLTVGSTVCCLYASVFGDPKAYLVRGAVLCIRDREAEQILCRKIRKNTAECGGSVRICNS